MNYIDLTLDNGSGVSNYNQLTNQPQINGVTLTGNKTTADLGIFLPDGYTITVATDGSGDFTDIQSALNSLNGKVCAGTIIIDIAAGTYNFNQTHSLVNMQLPFIFIKAADSNNKPIFKLTVDNINMLYINNIRYIYFRNIIFQGYSTDTTIVTHPNVSRTADIKGFSRVTFEGCTFNNMRNATLTQFGSETEHVNSTINYCGYAISSSKGGKSIVHGSIIATGCRTLFDVYQSGYCDTCTVTPTMSNVVNKYSQTVNVVTAAGLITGDA